MVVRGKDKIRFTADLITELIVIRDRPNPALLKLFYKYLPINAAKKDYPDI
jgi:hypothetical protein